MTMAETPDRPATETPPGSSQLGEPASAPARWFGNAWQSRSRRSLLRLLAAAGIASGFAILVGLLIALVTNLLDSGSSSTNTPPALAITPAPVSQVPADWVRQTASDGIVFRAPPGWTTRSDGAVEFRVQPAPGGGPGVEQVGVGVSSTGDPDSAATSYLTSTYSGQSSFLQQPGTDEVSVRGERGRQVTATYSRDGTPVQVVVRAFPTSRGTLLVVSRAAITDQARAEELATQLDASVQLS